MTSFIGHNAMISFIGHNTMAAFIGHSTMTFFIGHYAMTAFIVLMLIIEVSSSPSAEGEQFATICLLPDHLV